MSIDAIHCFRGSILVMILSVGLKGQTGLFMILLSPLKSITNLRETPSAFGTKVARAQKSVDISTGARTPSYKFF